MTFAMRSAGRCTASTKSHDGFNFHGIWWISRSTYACKLQQACYVCTLRSDLYVVYCRPGGLVARGKGFGTRIVEGSYNLEGKWILNLRTLSSTWTHVIRSYSTKLTHNSLSYLIPLGCKHSEAPNLHHLSFCGCVAPPQRCLGASPCDCTVMWSWQWHWSTPPEAGWKSFSKRYNSYLCCGFGSGRFQVQK